MPTRETRGLRRIARWHDGMPSAWRPSRSSDDHLAPPRALDVEFARLAAQGAEHGMPQAQHSLARFAQDHAQAARWYEQAAAQGHHGACHVVATMYEDGNCVRRDLERATFWHLQAVAHGKHGADPDRRRDVPALAPFYDCASPGGARQGPSPWAGKAARQGVVSA